MSFAAEPTSPAAAPAHGNEIEVKLAGPREILAALPGLEAFVGAQWKPRPHRMVATYFDTQNDNLAQAGVTLRVRRTGARRIMTLKSDPAGRSAFSRRESEVSLPGERPDVELFGPEIAAWIAALAMGQELVPRFETKVRRRVGELRMGETLIEIALDDGEIVAESDRLAIAECELEFKGGDPSVVFTLAAKLVGAGLSLSPAQKSERGYRLVRREPPAEVRAAPSTLRLDVSIEDAMMAIIEDGIGQFIGNWPALLEASLPESVHQMRVALRRLRSALGQFERIFPGAGFRQFREVAKTLSNELGAARDHDVLIALIDQGPRAAFPEEETFVSLLETISARRDEAYRRARDAIAAPDASRFVLELQAFVASRGWRNRLEAERLADLGASAVPFASQTLERLYQRARRMGKDLVRRDPEERHELRIALKNLRYCSEFFGSLYERGRVKKFNRSASVLQEALGEHNDAATALRLIGDDVIPASPAAGIVLGWCAREVTAPTSVLEDHWAAFKAARCYWRS
jgi:triphosphatase